MSTLFWLVLAYWLASVALGFVVATRVKTSGDFILPRRKTSAFMPGISGAKFFQIKRLFS